MNIKGGFTLIELLAVIVILAIIAVIAVPIVLNIIDESKDNANKRSIDMYARAVENAIASYQLNKNEAPTKFKDLYISNNGVKDFIEYDGTKVECKTSELYDDGSFYLEGCTVNGNDVDYEYGTKKELSSTQVYKPQYYYFGFDWSGTVGTTAAPANPSSVPPTGEIRYLGYDVTNGVVSAAYACFVRNNTEYCIKGYDTEAFATNTEIIKDAYADVVDTDACSFDDGYSHCHADGLTAEAYPDGYLNARDSEIAFVVYDYGYFTLE